MAIGKRLEAHRAGPRIEAAMNGLLAVDGNEQVGRT
jgi:hypothetical protein